MRPRIDRSVAEVPPRPREGMSKTHLRHIARLPCVACGNSGVPRHAHHLMRTGTNERGMGRRNADRWSLPLCFMCHRRAHDNGDDEAWLAGRGVDGRSIAEALWRERGNEDGMRRVVERSLLGRRRHEGVE